MANDGKSPKELMEYRCLGRTGLKVSVLSFGAWVIYNKTEKLFVLSSVSNFLYIRAR